MNVVMIGSGKVAALLSKKIHNAGLKVLQVYSPNLQHATLLADIINAEATNNIENIIQSANIYIIAIADDSIEGVASKLNVSKKALVLHTSGAVNINVLKSCSDFYGVLYPIQSISKTTDNNAVLPFAIDANNDIAMETIKFITNALHSNVEILNDLQRLHLHIAAVFVNNFVNFLYFNASNICKDATINFNILQPLIEETALRLRNNLPEVVFTGPAIRKDFSTINKHLKVLETNEQLFELYYFLTKCILVKES